MSDTITPTLVTSYQAAKVLNVILEEEGLPTIKPQMIYNYVRKGYILSTDGKVDLTATGEKSFTSWVKTYIEKKRNQGSQATAQDLRALINI